MNDFYTEQLVKRKVTPGTVVIKAGLIAITIAAAVLIFLLFPFALPAVIALFAIDWFLFKRMDVEYEYMYINGNLDIDKIMAKEKRKNMFTCNIADMEIIAPSGASELRPFAGIKTVDYTTRTAGAKVYEMVIAQGGEKKKVIFEPNETILNGMKMIAPRKVLF